MNFPPERPRLVFLEAFACFGDTQANLRAGFHVSSSVRSSFVSNASRVPREELLNA